VGLKLPGHCNQHRLQLTRIDPIGCHHGEGNRIGEEFGQRELTVIHRVPFRTGVEIGPHARYIERY
jgi:hypothetical protein